MKITPIAIVLALGLVSTSPAVLANDGDRIVPTIPPGAHRQILPVRDNDSDRRWQDHRRHDDSDRRWQDQRSRREHWRDHDSRKYDDYRDYRRTHNYGPPPWYKRDYGYYRDRRDYRYYQNHPYYRRHHRDWRWNN